MNLTLFSRRLLDAARRVFSIQCEAGLGRFQPVATRVMFAHRRVTPGRLLRIRHSQGW